MIPKDALKPHLTFPAAILVAAAVLVSGCRPKQQAGSRPADAPEVATLSVETETVVLNRELPGRTAPCLIAEIRPQVSGIIEKRLFEEGADVEVGDVLYEIDARTYHAAVQHAEAAVAGARANHATAVAAQARAQASQANAGAALAAAEASHATALAACDTAKAALAAAEAGQTSAEARAAPIRLRFKRFSELVASNAISKQDFDDTSGALAQAEAAIVSAKAMVQGGKADVTRAEASVKVALAQIQQAKAGQQSSEAEIASAEAAVQAAKAAIVSAEAALETARINLGYTKLTAPISGRIGRSAVTSGALVTAHQPLALATIRQLDPIYVDVTQATADLLRLQRRLADGRLSNNGAKDTVSLMLEDGRPYPHEGALKFREVSVDPSTGSFILRMVFPNPDRILLPGMFVRGVIQEGVDERAILVPQQSVDRTPKGEPFVWLVDGEGKVQQRIIVVDRAVGDRWLVTSGLNPGDRVIVEGKQKVRAGASVKAVPLSVGTQNAAAAETSTDADSPAN